MPYLVKPVRAFDKGIVDQIGDDKIPETATPASSNFLNLGDKIELVRGQLLLGDEDVTSGFITGLGVGIGVDGVEHMFKSHGTYLKRYDADSDAWVTVKNDLTDGADLSMAAYRTPAGSFMWINGQQDGPLRINMANPSDVYNAYASGTNYHGYITVYENRMFLWKKVGDETLLYTSWLDNDWPYTTVASESLGAGDDTTVTFTGTLAHTLIAGRLFGIAAGAVEVVDDGTGVLASATDDSAGTINYTTGVYSVTFETPPALATPITAAYSYEQPNTEGVSDFRYSTTRVAGEGNYFFQAQGSDELELVVAYDEKFYALHSRSIWVVDLTDDDTGATNKIYRENTGIPNWRAGLATGDGIFYIDQSDDDNKVARLLEYDNLATRVLPRSVSDSINLNGYNFDDGAMIEFGDYIIWACKEGDAESNNTVLLYNKKWELWDKIDGFFRCFVVFDGKLYGGSSVNNNVYQLFTGFDDDESYVAGSWESRDWDLGVEELKKCKKLVVEGEMSSSQELIVELSLDEQEWTELGRIAGTSEYVQTTSGTEYGSVMYGNGTYGADETVTAYRYMREFKLGSDKFLRAKIRFRTEEYGYLSVTQFIFKDVRLKGYKLPAMFR